MPSQFTLQPLLELMRDRTDEASRQLDRLIASEQSARSRLELLQQYRSEYAQRFQEAQTHGLTLQAWQNYLDFLGKIDEAIAQQQGHVDNSVQETAAGQAHWKAQHTRLKAIDTLASRHQRALFQKELKQEQKQLDEYASRRAQHNTPS